MAMPTTLRAPADELTRRGLLTGAGALGALTVLPGSAWGQEAGEPAFPVTIDHKFGSTVISAEPQRVLSLGFADQDAILALGVTPIAARYWFGDAPDAVFPWARDELGDAHPEVLEMPELNFEQIAGLRPDLIISVYSGITEQDYRTLTQIAPTVAQAGEYIDFGMPWNEMTLHVGRVLGRQAQSEKLVADVEVRFSATRRDHPEFVGASLVLASPPDGGQYSFFNAENRRVQVFTSIGFEVPADLVEIAGEEFFGTVSAERLDLFDTDVLVWHQLDGGGRAVIEADPFVQRLDATREGRVVFLEGVLPQALAFSSVLSLPFLLDGLVPMLAAAIDGDPTTEVTS